MAEYSDLIIDIEPEIKGKRRYSGGTWTAHHAESIGKIADYVTIVR